MCSLPAYLSPEINLDGSWEDILERLYSVFRQDFILSEVDYDGVRVTLDTRKIIPKKELGNFCLTFLENNIVIQDKKDKDYVFWNVFEVDDLKQRLKEIGVLEEKRGLVLSKFIKFNKEKVFWHLIEKKNRGKLERVIEYPSAKIIHWVKPTIINHLNSEVIDFDYLEGSGKIRKYLWLKNFDYVVILEPNRNKALGRIVSYSLVTAFHMSRGKKEDIESKYKKEVKN